ncbi:MAG: beta-propeller fold lactonase family protein, partial [Tepidisphaeraceae bacterium]
MPRSLAFFIAILALIHVVCAPALAADCFLYIGTQSESPSAGISLAHFDSTTGVLSTPRLLLPVDGPSFFALAPDGKHLYSTNYTHAGGVSTFSIDSATGNLT